MARLPFELVFLSPYEILPKAQENKYLWKFSYFMMQLYVVSTHLNRRIETILISTTHYCVENKKKSKLLLFAFRLGTMWRGLTMSRTIFYGPKDVRAIEVRLYKNLLIFLMPVLSMSLASSTTVLAISAIAKLMLCFPTFPRKQPLICLANCLNNKKKKKKNVICWKFYPAFKDLQRRLPPFSSSLRKHAYSNI